MVPCQVALVLATFFALLQRALSDFRAIEFLPDVLPGNASLRVDVPVECLVRVARGQKYDFWKKHLDFVFGRISRAQWETLRGAYAAPWAGPAILVGRTPLFDPFDAARSYRLLDFMPLTVRGLCDLNFAEEDEPFPSGVPMPPPPPAAPHISLNKTILVPNCWNAVYETLRTVTQSRNDEHDIFYDAYSTDDKDAQTWLEGSTSVVPGPYEEAERKFGDVMFIFLRDKAMKRPILQHAVMFVDQGVVFEKAGTGSRNPFRLTDLATVEKEWPPSNRGGLYSWQLRRPHFRAEQRRTFAERFSMLAQEPDERWRQFWQWSSELQRWYSVGRGDNPRKPLEIHALNILKARRYVFARRADGRWIPRRPDLSLQRSSLRGRAPASPPLPGIQV